MWTIKVALVVYYTFLGAPAHETIHQSVSFDSFRACVNFQEAFLSLAKPGYSNAVTGSCQREP